MGSLIRLLCLLSVESRPPLGPCLFPRQLGFLVVSLALQLGLTGGKLVGCPLESRQCIIDALQGSSLYSFLFVVLLGVLVDAQCWRNSSQFRCQLEVDAPVRI